MCSQKIGQTKRAKTMKIDRIATLCFKVILSESHSLKQFIPVQTDKTLFLSPYLNLLKTKAKP